MPRTELTRIERYPYVDRYLGSAKLEKGQVKIPDPNWLKNVYPKESTIKACRVSLIVGEPSQGLIKIYVDKIEEMK